MTAKEHNEAVYAEVKRMVEHKIKESLSFETEYVQEKIIGVVLRLFPEPQFQHIVITHFGYSRPIEETARVLSDRMITGSGIEILKH